MRWLLVIALLGLGLFWLQREGYFSAPAKLPPAQPPGAGSGSKAPHKGSTVVYQWKDADGHVQFGDRPPPGAMARRMDVGGSGKTQSIIRSDAAATAARGNGN